MSIEKELTGQAQEILTDHPQERVVVCEISLCSYQGYWVPTSLMKGILSVQKHFVANDSDIIVASCPKSGTTWLKAITFSVINCGRFAANDSPLLRANPMINIHSKLILKIFPNQDCLALIFLILCCHHL